jgi:hypothetical protein
METWCSRRRRLAVPPTAVRSAGVARPTAPINKYNNRRRRRRMRRLGDDGIRAKYWQDLEYGVQGSGFREN